MSLKQNRNNNINNKVNSIKSNINNKLKPELKNNINTDTKKKGFIGCLSVFVIIIAIFGAIGNFGGNSNSSQNSSSSAISSKNESKDNEDNKQNNNSDNVFDFSSSDFPFGEVDTGSLELKYGELLSVIHNEGTVIVKAKIQPNLTNELTIEQNYYSVGDLIKEHGFNTCEELQYWAVADMSSGDEDKVISFDLSKDIIDSLYKEEILENQIGDYADNLFVHGSLTK
jgi:hypothetical protein